MVFDLRNALFAHLQRAAVLVFRPQSSGAADDAADHRHRGAQRGVHLGSRGDSRRSGQAGRYRRDPALDGLAPRPGHLRDPSPDGSHDLVLPRPHASRPTAGAADDRAAQRVPAGERLGHAHRAAVLPRRLEHETVPVDQPRASRRTAARSALRLGLLRRRGADRLGDPCRDRLGRRLGHPARHS